MAKATRKKQVSAQRFQAARRQHRAEAAEDYTELVAELIESQGEARVKDIAKSMGITHVTALRTISRLKREGLLDGKPRHPISLTRRGQQLAAKSKERHQILIQFFIKLGVPPAIAAVDVEGVEHHFSDISLQAIKKFLGQA